MLCTVTMVSNAFFLRWWGSLNRSANLHALTLALGFLALTAMEGGARGHALAWLASVSLCALLLLDEQAALAWCIFCFGGVLAFVTLELQGIAFPALYPEHWTPVITAAGYLSLTLFMCLLGLIFERSRKKAFNQLQTTLGELSAANERLRTLNQEKSDLLGIVAHDLRNPLNAVQGFAEFIVNNRKGNVEQMTNDARQIIRAAVKMNHLINDLLDLNAIEEGKMKLRLEAVELHSAVASTLQVHQMAAEVKGISLQMEPAGTPINVKADHRAFMQIVDNLVTNALKFSPKNSQVHISVSQQHTSASVRVRDQGPGLRPEDHARLFQKFAKLSARPTAGEAPPGSASPSSSAWPRPWGARWTANRSLAREPPSLSGSRSLRKERDISVTVR
ncbi:MAG: HAMP domain-containing sensor histidine kinase [Chthoniobacteraceae bacterium]